MPIAKRLPPGTRVAILALASLALTVGMTAAAGAAPSTGRGDEDVRGQVLYRAGRSRPASAMLREADAALEATRTTLAGLEKQRALATQPEEIADLERRIEAAKRGLQVRLFEVQLLHARRAGRAELASRLERRLTALRNAADGVAPARGEARP